MAADLGLYLTSINSSKKNVMRESMDPAVITGYPGYIINKLLSYHKDAVLIVNAINQLPHLDAQLQYEFLLNALPKGKRFSKLHKAVTPENLAVIKEYYNYSSERAMEVLDLHTPEELAEMKKYFEQGGVSKNKRKKT